MDDRDASGVSPGGCVEVRLQHLQRLLDAGATEVEAGRDAARRAADGRPGRPRSGRGWRRSRHLAELATTTAAGAGGRPFLALAGRRRHLPRRAARACLQLIEGDVDPQASYLQRRPSALLVEAPRSCPPSRSSSWRDRPRPRPRTRAGRRRPPAVPRGRQQPEARLDARLGLVEAGLGQRLARQRAAHLGDLGLDGGQRHLRLAPRLPRRRHAALPSPGAVPPPPRPAPP